MIDKDTRSIGDRIQAAAGTKDNQDLLTFQPDLWKDIRGGKFANYCSVNNPTKGMFGESVASDVITSFGLTVTKALGPGHDRRINGIRTEIKISLAQTNRKKNQIIKNLWMINHVGLKKDWERVILLLINPNREDDRVVWFSKESFLEMIKTNEYFTFQQGGERGENDDRMSTGKRVMTLINSRFAKDLSEW